MPDRLRILHLEDSAPESRLIHSHLAAAGLPCDLVRVDNQADFERTCAEGTDLVLADYSLPAFDGPTALRIARKACPDVPVIFLSGALSEEEAVELIKAGAIDFVRKDRLDRLVPAIERALREVEERRERRCAQEALGKLNAELDQRVRERTAQLEASARKLRELAIQLTKAEQRERERLAHVLHDDLQQLLASARMQANVLLEQAPTPALATGIARVEELLRQAIETSRALTLDLCPPALFDRGIIPAIRWLARRAQEEHGLATDVTTCPDAEVHAEALRILLFVAVRELLLNVVKHSGTLRARLSVSRPTPDVLEIIVEDAGRGFTTTAPVELAPERHPSGFGLYGISERLRLLGGTLDVTSAPGQGTRAVLRVPADARLEDPEPRATRPDGPGRA